MKHEMEGSSTPPPTDVVLLSATPSDPFLTGSRRWVQKVRPFFLSFFINAMRRGFPLLVVFSVCFQQRGGFWPSSLCFLCVLNGEEGQNPSRHVFCFFVFFFNSEV